LDIFSNQDYNQDEALIDSGTSNEQAQKKVKFVCEFNTNLDVEVGVEI
jgi:hypothetical protein